MIKSVKKWWEDKSKPTTPTQRAANPTNLKAGIDTIKDHRKRKDDQLKRIMDEM